jgi:nicotinate-nucleotide pyrophosphorylase (carboxylating)
VSRPFDPHIYRDIVRAALAEDVGAGDVTTNATVDAGIAGRGVFVVKADCVLAGLDVAIETFRQVAPGGAVSVTLLKHDGDRCVRGDIAAEVTASARTLLVGERTALNFLQRLSGIATMTRRFVDASEGRITVLDTRKTTPTLRALEKYAVRAGGGTNHRVGLFDAILIKDNHVRLAGGVAAAIARARAERTDLVVEVEAQTLSEVDEALAAKADIVLVDNMSTDDIRAAVAGGPGGGPRGDYTSVGALTHSAPAVDISFEIEAAT